MCQQLGVTEQGYYAWLKRPVSKHEQEDAELLDLIVYLFGKLRGNPGRRRVWAGLVALGRRVSPKRVHRLMTIADLAGRHPRAWRKTTIRGERPNYAPDLLKQDFTATEPNQKWCSDITYVRTWDGWAYLATVIDLHSRKVVGWALAHHMRTDLVEDALRMAINRRKPSGSVIFHSDKGTQYTSNQFVVFCKRHNIRRSMGRTGVCFDNAVAESFFATYKKELIHTQPWPTLKHLAKATFEWIEEYYNNQRRHATLGYLTPAEYELGYRTLEEIYAKAA